MEKNGVKMVIKWFKLIKYRCAEFNTEPLFHSKVPNAAVKPNYNSLLNYSPWLNLVSYTANSPRSLSCVCAIYWQIQCSRKTPALARLNHNSVWSLLKRYARSLQDCFTHRMVAGVCYRLVCKEKTDVTPSLPFSWHLSSGLYTFPTDCFSQSDLFRWQIYFSNIGRACQTIAVDG